MAEVRELSPPTVSVDLEDDPSGDVGSVEENLDVDDNQQGPAEEQSEAESYIPSTASFGEAAEEAESVGVPSDGGVWQNENEVDQCPLCSVKFSTFVWRHHCRHCGGLVCENCSRTRLRLPRLESTKKQRVCDACCLKLADQTSTSIAEDLEVKNEVLKQLRSALSERCAECEVFKRVLLELDAESTGDRSLLEQYFKDPQSDAASFENLKERARNNWDALMERLQTAKETQATLKEKLKEACEKRDVVLLQYREEVESKKELDVAHDDFVRTRAENDRLVRKEQELVDSLDFERKTVRDLELQRSEEQRTRALRTMKFRPPRSWSADATGNVHPMAITTISAGRSDSIGGRGRLDACRRACSVM